MTRISTDEYFIGIARLVAQRATCHRRQVGCVLVNSRNHVLATGYNGVASGQPHCIDRPCPGAHCASGTGLHLCQAIHAEANALIQCADIGAISTAYVTASPCISCLRLLLNTSCRTIVFAEEYPHPESRDLWVGDGRQWIHHGHYVMDKSFDRAIGLPKAAFPPV
jgi:dCMP deaminase